VGAVLYFARQAAIDRHLGRRCGKSIPAINRSLGELEAKGWIERLSGDDLLQEPMKGGQWESLADLAGGAVGEGPAARTVSPSSRRSFRGGWSIWTRRGSHLFLLRRV